MPGVGWRASAPRLAQSLCLIRRVSAQIRRELRRPRCVYRPTGGGSLISGAGRIRTGVFGVFTGRRSQPYPRSLLPGSPRRSTRRAVRFLFRRFSRILPKSLRLSPLSVSPSTPRGPSKRLRRFSRRAFFDRGRTIGKAGKVNDFSRLVRLLFLLVIEQRNQKKHANYGAVGFTGSDQPGLFRTNTTSSRKP